MNGRRTGPGLGVLLAALTVSAGGWWTPARAAVIHVPKHVPSIQAGIDAAHDGDTVVVADGVYQGPGNKNVNFRGKAITVRSAGGPWKCIIDCEHDGNAFVFDSEEGLDSVLEGFTIRNGRALYGGAIRIAESSPTIRRCIFLDNTGQRKGGVDGYGGAIYCRDDILVNSLVPWREHGPCRPVISNCIFSGNSANYGGAIYAFSDGPLSATEPVILHCTFTGNHATLEGGALYNWMADPTVKNSIFWNNTAGTLYPEIRNVGSSPQVTYSNVRGGYPGQGNIDRNPLFVGEGDFRLRPGSPCINQGADAGVYRDIDGDARPLLGGFDIGADEYGGPCWDADGDGFASHVCGGPDCDDSNANIFPGNPNPYCNCLEPYPGGTSEIAGDGIDNNCNGLVDEWD